MEAARKLENQTRFLLRVTRLWPTMTTVERQVLRGATTGVRVFSVDELTAITHDALECDEKLAIANALLESVEGKNKTIDDKKESSEKQIRPALAIIYLTINVADCHFDITASATDDMTFQKLRTKLRSTYNTRLRNYNFTDFDGKPYAEDKTFKEQGIRSGSVIYTKWWPQVNGV